MLKYGGIFCDVHTLWFKEFPKGFMGHVIASFEARRHGNHGTWELDWAVIRYLRDASDYLCIATPVQAPRGSPCFFGACPGEQRPERVQSSHSASGYDILGGAKSVFAKGGLFPIAVHSKARA